MIHHILRQISDKECLETRAACPEKPEYALHIMEGLYAYFGFKVARRLHLIIAYQ